MASKISNEKILPEFIEESGKYMKNQSSDSVEEARLTHALPAQERTRQAEELTKQVRSTNLHETIRTLSGLLFLLGTTWVINTNPTNTSAILVFFGIGGFTVIIPKIIDILTRRK